jgi:hypothetical protein
MMDKFVDTIQQLPKEFFFKIQIFSHKDKWYTNVRKSFAIDTDQVPMHMQMKVPEL